MGVAEGVPGERYSLGLPEHCDERLRELHAYWEARRPAPGLLPSRASLDPAEIRGLLPWLWLVDVVREPLRFRYRLIGTGHVRIMGRDYTGRFVHEVPGASGAHAAYRQFSTVVETGEAAFRAGHPAYNTEHSYVWLERLLCPLAADGRTVDMILAITVYGSGVDQTDKIQVPRTL